MERAHIFLCLLGRLVEELYPTVYDSMHLTIIYLPISGVYRFINYRIYGSWRRSLIREIFALYSTIPCVLIVEIGNSSPIQKEGRVVIYLTNSQILIPGLIDTHIHAPQYPNVGLGSDKTLLDWLLTYTYPTEAKYKDLAYSNTVYSALVKKTIAYGTTTACYFGSLFRESTLTLAETIVKYGQRALVGKINMILLAPDNYIESREKSISETQQFISDIKSKQNELILPVISPRFALSVDTDHMLQLAKIAKEEDVHIQSHISENIDEICSVQEQYKVDYATAYDNGGMLTNKTIMAHGIHLTDSELKLLKERGTSISHCPASNTFLKSGLCDIRRIQKYEINVGLGTDVSGGPSPSIIDAMRSAITTSNHFSMEKENYAPLTYEDVFYMATLGGAKALSLDHKIGNFEVGKQFDALVVDMNVNNASADYFDNCNALELLQKFIFLGDDRNVIMVYVAGIKVK